MKKRLKRQTWNTWKIHGILQIQVRREKWGWRQRVLQGDVIRHSAYPITDAEGEARFAAAKEY